MYLNKLPIGLCVISTLILLPLANFYVESALTSPKQLVIEENRVFWVYNYAIEGYCEVNSRLLATGDSCYIYMDEECIPKLGEESIMARVDEVCHEFDNIIYPGVIDLSGHPNGTMGDIDGDPKIFILFTDCHNYYSEANEIEHNISNRCEMFYINYRLYPHYLLYTIMAHEFQHLIWFNNEWDEPPFTLEALSQYAMYHTGYLGPYNNLAPQVASFLPHPENSPLYWNNDEDYGSVYLFAFYIAEKYGVQILRDLINESSDGPQGIEAVLQSAGHDVTFNELFMNWITALSIDELGFQNNLFGFEGCDARITRYEVLDKLPLANKSISITHYAFYLQKLETPPNNFTVIINKSPQDAIGVSFAVHDSFGWQVKQNLHYEETSTITDSFSGVLVDEVYIITTYISKETPIALPHGRGSGGPSIDIEITIIEGVQKANDTSSSNISTTTTNNTNPFSDLQYVFVSLCILVIFSYKKRK